MPRRFSRGRRSTGRRFKRRGSVRYRRKSGSHNNVGRGMRIGFRM